MDPLNDKPLVLKSGKHLQPIEAGNAFRRHAANLDRLAADRRLLDRLMWAQYAGRDWDLFRAALAEYALAVLGEWIFKGRIFAECKRKGRSLRRRGRIDQSDALSLAGETVVDALRFFRTHVLIPGLWDMTRGATIRTYFIGACILHFPNVYHRSARGAWLDAFLAKDDQDAAADVATDDGDSRPDRHAFVMRALARMPNSETREIILGTAAGYTQQEIADKLGISRKSVETRLARLHRRTG